MLKLLSLILIAGLFIACGKKEKSSESGTLQPVIPDDERQEFLNKQEIVCEAGTYCPDYIAKIVVFDKGQPRFCTGTLVAKNLLLTSTSCLPSYLRRTDADCSKDVTFFFNRGNRTPEQVKCAAITQISELDGNSAEYWRDDVAILQLQKNLNWREFRDVTRKGFTDGLKVRFFAVEQANDFTGVIKKEECEVVLGSYLYPLSATESSPNVILSGCTKKSGYRGASILDSFPRIRGVLSDLSSLRSSLENSTLLIKPLKDFVHVSSFACAQFLDENSAQNEQECAKNLDYTSIARERERILSDQERFGSIIERIEGTANAASRYFKIAAVLNPVGDRHVLSFQPVCFKNVSSWLNSVKGNGDVPEQSLFPAQTLRKGVDSNGRAVTQEVEEKNEKYYFIFSGKRLFKEKLSDVFLSTDTLPTRRINGIKACL